MLENNKCDEVLFTHRSNKGRDPAPGIRPTASSLNKTRRMPIMGPLLRTQLPHLPFKLAARGVDVCGMAVLSCSSTRVTDERGGGRGGGGRRKQSLQAICSALVFGRLQQNVDSSSVVSVGSLEKDAGSCRSRGGNGHLYQGLGGHGQSGEGGKMWGSSSIMVEVIYLWSIG